MKVHIPNEAGIILTLDTATPKYKHQLEIAAREYIGNVIVDLTNGWSVTFFKRHGRIKYVDHVSIPVLNNCIVQVHSYGWPEGEGHVMHRLADWEPPHWWCMGPEHTCAAPPVYGPPTLFTSFVAEQMNQLIQDFKDANK